MSYNNLVKLANVVEQEKKKKSNLFRNVAGLGLLAAGGLGGRHMYNKYKQGLDSGEAGLKKLRSHLVDKMGFSADEATDYIGKKSKDTFKFDASKAKKSAERYAQEKQDVFGKMDELIERKARDRGKYHIRKGTKGMDSEAQGPIDDAYAAQYPKMVDENFTVNPFTQVQKSSSDGGTYTTDKLQSYGQKRRIIEQYAKDRNYNLDPENMGLGNIVRLDELVHAQGDIMGQQYAQNIFKQQGVTPSVLGTGAV